MKITHLCLGSFYIDGYSYQENLLPKFHKNLGYDVEIIASMITFDQNGNEALMKKSGIYYNENGIKVTRVDFKKKPFYKLNKKLKRFNGLYESLKNSNTDILFIHGCQFLDMKVVVQYLEKNKNIKVYVDNHADFSNSAQNFLSKNILHKVIWKRSAHLIEPYTTKFYGVLPSRVEFLENIYKIPSNKVELLVMGADDDKVEIAKNPEKRKKIRNKYGIEKDDFLIMTGGKIDNAKKQTLLLMEAVKNIPDKKVKLIVFGSVIPELQDEINGLVDSRKIQYIGWVKSEESYKYFAAADLVVFPGRHSVFWEQVAGQGIPMIVKWWKGTTHVDLDGNVIFLRNDSVNDIKIAIEKICSSPEEYEKMLKASEKGKEIFSYQRIAEQSISN